SEVILVLFTTALNDQFLYDCCISILALRVSGWGVLFNLSNYSTTSTKNQQV
ncbi:hypothetical protein ACJX0J_016258, partial [Zea mays]